LTLKDAEQRAVDGHPQVRAGRSAALAASQVVREVKSAYWPTVFASVTGAASSPDGARISAGALNNPSIYDRFAAGFTVSQLVTDFGRTADLAQTQTLRANAQEQNATRVRADVLLRVDQTYFDALRAQAVLRVARQTVEARQLVADQVTALAASNLKSGLDVSFARVNLSQAQLLLVQAQSDVDGSSAALGAAMGTSAPATYDLVDEPMPPPPPDDSAPLIAQAFRERPDLAAEQLADQAAAKFAEAEHALWYPTVAAVGTAGVTPYHQDPLTDHYAAAGFNVTLPIANGSLYSARHAEAAHRAEIEDETLRDLQNQITRDVTLAWLQARTGYQRVDLTNQLLAQASDALELAQARYNLGLSSIVELTQGQLNKTQAEIDQATVRYEYQARISALRYQTGVLK
jgi:outer membrane protein